MNIAELGIRVDSTQAATASTELGKLATAGERAEQSAVGLMDEMKALERALAKGAQSTQELAKQRDALTKLTKAGAYGEAEFSKITASLDKQQAALVKSTLEEQKALNSLLGAIDPARAALDKLDRQVEALGKHLDAGRISQQQFNDAMTRVEGRYAELEKTRTALDKLNLSTKGAQQNVLQLGTALSSGDWTGAVRNVAQLGVAAGTSATGFLAMAAPIAAVAAGIAGLTYAWYQGRKEAQSYHQALIMTGNYAGKSVAQLSSLARQVGAVHGTTGEAAASLSKLAASGVIAGESFGAIASAAAAMEEATGKSVDATIAEFVKIAKDPVAAAKDLNSQYHFLTASVYAQVVALKEQGDHVSAVKLVTDNYSDVLQNRTPQVTENLGLWERAWRDVTKESKKALDAFLNFGRPDVDAAIEQAQQDLARATHGEVGLFQNRQVMIDFYDNKLNMLRDEKAAKADIAKYDAEQARIHEEGIAALIRVKAVNSSNLTPLEKRNKLQREYLADIEKIRLANAEDPRVAPQAVDKGLANIAEQNKDEKPAGGQPDLSAFNRGKNQLAAALGYYKNLEKELDASQKAGITSQERYHAQRIALIQQQASEVEAAYQAEINALESAKRKKGISAAQVIQIDQKIAAARAAMVQAQQDAESQLQVLATLEQGRVAKQKAMIDDYVAALGRQAEALRLAGERAAIGVGQGTRQRDLNRDLDAITDRANQQRLDLERDKADASRNMSAEEYHGKLAAINQSEIDLKETTLKNYEEMATAQNNWRNGATSAFANYLDSARDVAGQTRNLFTGAFSSMEDAIVNFAMTGKLSFADFTKSILADMARIAARQAMLQMLGSLVGSFMSSGPKSLGSTPQGYGPEFFPQAKGGAWESGVQLFAKGGAFSDGVVNTPTAFGMSGGKKGIMGEDGPEAIMPLTRTASGALGVRAVGGGGGGNVYSFPINVSIDASGTNTATGGNPEAGAELGRGIQDAAKAEAEAAIRKGLQPGGRIWMAIKGRG